MNDKANPGLNHSWLINAVQEKYGEKKLGKLISIAVEPMDLKDAASFTSDLQRVKVVFNNEIGNKKCTIMLVAKVNRPVEHDGRDTEENIWDNRIEVEIYVNVLRPMEDLMIEFDDQRELLGPIMYGYVPYSTLLLEDLGQRYTMLPRTVWLDEEHSFLALRSIGRYHAMSKVLIERGFNDEPYINSYICANRNRFHQNLFGGSVVLLSEVMVKKMGSWEFIESSQFLGKRLQLWAQTVCERRTELYQNFDERFLVLNHGDFRSGNMMFKIMEYTGRPTDVKFFDFQFPHINTFGWDLSYVISSSIEPSFRRAHRKKLLEVYQQSLADNLKFFKFEGYVPTIDDVEKEFDRLALVQLSNMITMLPLVLSSSDHSLSLDKISTHSPEEAINKIIFTEEQFVNVIIGDLEQAINMKVI